MVYIYIYTQKIILANDGATKYNRVELDLSGLIGTEDHLDMQKIRIIRFFFENMLHWHFEVRLLLFTLLLKLSNTPDLKF